MDKIEQIKAEIERLIEVNKTKNGFPAGTICAARIEAYEVLIKFINSLPEEKPSGDLEQAAKDAAAQFVYESGTPFPNSESYQRIATAIIVDIPREVLGNKVEIVIVKEESK